ncbi:MAG TPA: serine/threonine-protein kinase [Polyangiaceae bacterium]|nr:serine/threonine-protein kinase [Polyangiaceae bacterium]
MTEALVGETVDTRYELRRLIAHGGMGLVFEAAHRFTRRIVALKLLPDDLRAQKEARGRLLREAHALTAVRHPGFVEVLDAGVCAANGPYVVLEMLEGRTLDGILAARRRLSIADAVQIGRQVCDALAHAHARGVVHRDLKPSNIFVARNEIGDEMVKLIDLGVAAVAQEQLADRDRKLTAAHEVLGTPEYMAPEQLWGRAIDARTDVYALGMTLYECLTGEVPYTGSYPDVLVQVSNASAPPSVRERRADVPPALAVVIENALEKDAAARFQSVMELSRALVAASGLPAAASALLSVSDDDGPDSEREDQTEPEIKLVKKKKAPPKGAAPDDRPSAPGSGPVSGPSQKRHFVRAPYVTPVSLVLPDGASVEARSEEISEEGMLVVSPMHFPLGAPLAVRFASPLTGEMIAIDASVRWTRDGRGKSAVGLEFVTVPPVLRRVVADFIASLTTSVA